jgi:hypothetical protein
MKALGYEGHQFMIVAHDDKKHFHIHIMLNKVHPWRLSEHIRHIVTGSLSMPQYASLKRNMAGHTRRVRCDGMRNQKRLYCNRNPSAMRLDLPNNIRPEPLHNLNITRIRNHSNLCAAGDCSARVRTLLTRQNVTWDDLHRLLSKAHLKLEKGESGGYTVLAVDYNIRVKASDVFRNNFAGKINRQATEAALGPWTPASTSGYEADQQVAQHSVQHVLVIAH